MRAINVILALLVSLAIGLGVLEFGLRLIPAFAPPRTLNRFDPTTGWSKEPGKTIVRKVAGQPIEFAINQAGLREDPGVGPEKEPNTFRVLLLGDSFVLGFTVNRENLFGDLLERWWQSEERRADVVNTGTEGWSTDQEVAWFQDHGRSYRPDLVLAFPYENDVFWNGQPVYATGVPKPRFEPDGRREARELAAPPERGWLGSLAIRNFARVVGTALRSRLGRLSGGPRAPGPFEFVPAGASAPISSEFAVLLDDPPPFVAECVARTEGALLALKQSCEEIGAKLVLVPIPSKSAISPAEREFFRSWQHGLGGLSDQDWSPDRPVNLFLELAQEHGITALDPRSALLAANEAQPLYFERDVEWHFNAAGNRAFATWLHDELDRREVFPAEHRARATGALPVAVAGSGGGVPTWLLVYAGLWAVLGTGFCLTYPEEPKGQSFLSVGALLALVFTIILGGGALVRRIPAAWAPWIVLAFVALVLGFVAFKLGRRLGTILELVKAFTLRGHWYLMPLVVILLTIGSLLVVAASSPLIAPFIYTLF